MSYPVYEDDRMYGDSYASSQSADKADIASILSQVGIDITDEVEDSLRPCG